MINNQRQVYQGQRVVLDIVKLYMGTWKRDITQNFFTSIPLAEELVEIKRR